MKDHRAFAKPCPAPPVKPTPPKIDYPEKPDVNLLPARPRPNDPEFQPRFAFLDDLMGWKQKKIDESRQRYELALETWKDRARSFNKQVEEYNEAIKQLKEEHEVIVRQFSQVYALDMKNYQNHLNRWNNEKAEYESELERKNQLVEASKALYFDLDPAAVQEYCSAILSRSKFPDCCPQNFEMSYLPETKTLVVDYYFPKLEDIPSVKAVKFNQSQSKHVETHLSEIARNRLYEDSTYKIILRCLHELFNSDDANALKSVVFNGVVETVDKSTGREIRPCILSVQVAKAEFLEINWV